MALNWNQVQLPSFAASNQMAAQGADTVLKAIGGLQGVVDLGQERYNTGEQGKLNAFDAALQKMGNEELSTMTEADIVKQFGINDPRTMQLALAEQQGRNDVVQQRIDANAPVWQQRFNEQGILTDALVDKGGKGTVLEWGNSKKQEATADWQTTGQYEEIDGKLYPITFNAKLNQFKTSDTPVSGIGAGSKGIVTTSGSTSGGESGDFNQQAYGQGQSLLRSVNNITDEDIGELTGTTSGLNSWSSGHKTAANKVQTVIDQLFTAKAAADKGVYGSLSNAEGSKLSGSQTTLIDPDNNQVKVGLEPAEFNNALAKTAIDASYLIELENWKYNNQGSETTPAIIDQLYTNAIIGLAKTKAKLPDGRTVYNLGRGVVVDSNGNVIRQSAK